MGAGKTLHHLPRSKHHSTVRVREMKSVRVSRPFYEARNQRIARKGSYPKGLLAIPATEAHNS